MTQTTDAVTSSSGLVVCAGCNVRISDRYLLSAVDKNWHEGCLKCSYCCGRLDELGSTLFVKNNAFFCRQDYRRLYGGSVEVCPLCQKDVLPMQMVMKEKGRTYHLECFNCYDCGDRYRVGDRFFFCEKDGQILCEEDYRRRLMRMAAAASTTATTDPPSSSSSHPSSYSSSSAEANHCSSARSQHHHHGSLVASHVLPPTDSLTSPPGESWTNEYLTYSSTPTTYTL